ncbi:tRNA (N6-isopentenyl adenosine(37)-C2)-methylthiotransferase MiaB [Anaeromyxobacter dehalogenans]|uniref:tRNA-2-methylthio-N(6)-dimethylallyladenosine synthase n=1 Tax=Anaeromyxobacter dehalogenans (strain 2CP-C) TaxID=290397 RepID=MIAB_ANADE|nr:tRNA (N6-isopentenyl adenosine(37)-C2)-methylthiotransferase MiaB [Anaeromyxobacter dehalogenans]Q2IKE9.1 RecName: Full=tRNA-2-methylthio-N(6)-dimethylallyladenosine synthase; AltName: Full=(Dimethylallyl)adenosine tRNA methylthiotransferase MiaB; AltName: Full=tRNA-i(6)A37 methylthiotransferase [Anaeromyxobacter dehalogenans 2CP-C]ABC82125.1 tRNA-i(6)A37 thiotransferase enzyme MiaB [Anaeromyxobacter dehalogenans 2CP-C]
MSDLVPLSRKPAPAAGDPAPSPAAPPRKVYVHTFGCQMNESDSDRMVELLGRHAYARAASADEADLILLNTCAVREKAEQKLLSALGRYREVKARRGALIAVSGCVAQQEKDRLLARVPYVDFVFGPDNIARLPEMVERARGERFAETGWMDSEEYVFPRADAEAARGRATAFVTAMKGCDNVCAFCIVPHTRGREVSRPFPDVVAECAALAAVGVREVTLIGQNVNSYGGGCTFADLLRRVAAVPGIDRIRFTTSHPHDLSGALVEVFRDEPKVMPHFHLPVQSGSDAVLRRMRRDYSVAEYLDRFDRLRAARPGIAITTDFIVGFPGETDADFEASLALLERARFEQSFSFVFSPRPHTVAAVRLGSAPEWQDVPRDVAVARLERLLAAQRRIAGEILAAELGKVVEVLVEGPSDEPGERLGRTPENRVVHLTADEAAAPAGARVPVRITRAGGSSLSGTLA